ncbi:MAG TPA: carboxypeptidase regulatory-like domain-containing protein [Terriglobales bacterium]|nr:carboxypeptidase regulatory-like domain-containing protein [Terriglobales bacterium]
MNRLISFFILLSVILYTGAASAQETRATLSGLVTDPSSAPVVGAKITVIEIRTGTKTATVSDNAGQYTVPFLPPGDYEINAEAQGFKQFVHRAVHIESGSHPVIDIRLQIGNNTESVTVTAETPLINSADASIGQGMTTQQVEDFPLNGRNPMMVTQLAIGVIATGNPTLVHPFDNGAASGWSMGGTPAQTAEILMDGAPNATWDNRAAYSPPQEAVQEVKVKAFNTDAAFGHTGSGTINEVMKTGTNKLHGSAYGFAQPSWASANSFFNNRNNVARPNTNFNQYGLTAGGPVIVPKLYNGRNKLFWFFAWEVLKDGQPNPKLLTVPTSAERQGDFSSLLTLGSQSVQIYNPYSGTLSGTKVNRKPFMCDASGNPLAPNMTPGPTFGTQASGIPCNKIPQQLLNPVALAYLKFYPQPNVTGTATGYSNYANTATTNDDYSNELGRLDWTMSERSRLAFNVRHNSEFQSKNNYFLNNTTGSDLQRNNWGATADEVFIINPSTVLNVRANYTRLNEFHPSPSAGFDPTKLGFPSNITSTSQYLQLPAISFGSSCGNDTTQAASFDCFSGTGSDRIPSQSYQLFGDVQKQLSSHSLRFGVDARQYKLDAQSFGAATGSYSFAGIGATNSWTNGPTASTAPGFGQDFAAFLLGLPTSGTYNLSSRGTYTGYYYGLFVQDDWRIRKNLTINLGLRYDHDTPYSEKLGRTVNGFASTATNPLAAAAVPAYNSKPIPQIPVGSFNVPGGLTFASPSDGSIYSNTSHLVSPRVGFAWSPDLFNGKTVIRGGFGVFVQPIALSNLAPTGAYSSSPVLTQEGFSQTTQLAVPSNFLLPTTTLSNPFPVIVQPAGSAAGLATFNGQSIDFLAPNAKNPYSERWTFGIQQSVTPNLLFEIAYIGNHSVHLPIALTQLNGIPRAYLSTLPYRDQALINSLTANTPNPFAGLIPNVASFNGATIAVRQLLAPFPQYPVADSTSFSSGVVEHNASLGSSSFNSLNVRVEKRMSHGLQLVTTYIWSKLIERDEWLNNTDPAPERRISPFDHSHRFITAVNYDLPIGNGKLLNLGSGWMDKVLGGWRINGIYTYQTGAPIVFMNGSTTNPGDYSLCSVAVTAVGSCPASATFFTAPLLLNNRQTVGTAFDTSHFATLTNYQFQFHLRTLPTTFSNLRQDGTNNLDASIIKRFAMTERVYIQLRLEAFNLLNHPTFGAPNLQATSTSFGIINTQANRPRQLQFGARFVF